MREIKLDLYVKLTEKLTKELQKHSWLIRKIQSQIAKEHLTKIPELINKLEENHQQIKITQKELNNLISVGGFLWGPI